MLLNQTIDISSIFRSERLLTEIFSRQIFVHRYITLKIDSIDVK